MSIRNRIYFSLLMAVLGLLSATAAEAPEIYIKTEIKKSGYVGEAFELVTYLTSSTPEISNVRITKSPELPQNLKIIKGVVKSSRPQEIKEKGKIYYKWIIQREYVIPEKAGKISIGESRYIAFIPHEKFAYQGFWGPQRYVEYEEAEVKCPGITFKVSELPPTRNESFSGCVGDFKVEGWFPPGKIRTGSEAYVVFTISGYGDLTNLKLPNLSKIFASGCRLKDVEQNEEKSQRDGKLYSEITLTCRFVAEADDFKISTLCIEFFSPSEKKYYSACSDELTWMSTPTPKRSEQDSKDAIAI